MIEVLYAAFALLVLIALIVLVLRLAAQARALREIPEQLGAMQEHKHRAMLLDLHDGLAKQGERVSAALADSSERLGRLTSEELAQTRHAMQALQLALNESLAHSREALQKTLAEEGRAEQELIQNTMHRSTQQFAAAIEGLTKKIDERLEQISGRVSERLDEGFRKTNETFINVMTRLATIDEAQKKIESLTGNVVSLQELLGDKRARGAFGEVQLEALVRNMLPQGSYHMQHVLPNGTRVDCLLKLPEPTGAVGVDSKFPLENYHRMLDSALAESERAAAQRQFKADLKKHIDDISVKYIIPGVTSDGAVMFVPAEAVFAEIHAYHADIVNYALQRRVWIVSPTTLMAVLNTARAVLKDVETRKQVHIIKDELGKLGKDFARFDERMRKLADHVRQAHEDAQQVQISSRKISERFASIERVELDHAEMPPLPPAQLGGEGEGGA
ncbi:MAG: DNA recombination protein RmuC [Burkholderiales bacterium]